ncbi:GNAT family N-acetyltransferase [Sanguibacter hominis ATCC BAA-789]|uniref:GNAT family N-acetyltransferase n=1 Tax=Sanguibacter hominis ATCC BAA-789 TaxID=1312740 RepID=A0A9X5F9Z5_9MICO|nr:GNAT family N-acetyltransferase [Sanguibacter hominis]NKX92591.1 GNAT family N-acetyltransferase [Sanguibacter hominis ATCC BAA-789]
MTSTRLATLADVPAAARTLALAFADYPWTRWTVPEEDHEARVEDLQALYLAHAVSCGLVLVDDDVTGVAAVLPPDAPDPPDEVQARVAELHGDRLERLISVPTPERPEGAWDFATLGVRPDRRGVGLGSAVLTEVLALVAERAPDAPVALETSDVRNVRLYERHGFAVTAHTDVPDGPDVFSMVRTPAR